MKHKALLNGLAVAGTAGFVGNMLTIGLGFGGYWQSLDPAELSPWFAENFFRFLIPTVSSVLPFSLLGLTASVWLERANPTTRRRWAGALACVVLACVITAVYHLPANLALASGNMGPGEARDTLSTWLALHWVRVALAILGTALGLDGYRRASAGAGPAAGGDR